MYFYCWQGCYDGAQPCIEKYGRHESLEHLGRLQKLLARYFDIEVTMSTEIIVADPRIYITGRRNRFYDRQGLESIRLKSTAYAQKETPTELTDALIRSSRGLRTWGCLWRTQQFAADYLRRSIIQLFEISTSRFPGAKGRGLASRLDSAMSWKISWDFRGECSTDMTSQKSYSDPLQRLRMDLSAILSKVGWLRSRHIPSGCSLRNINLLVVNRRCTTNEDHRIDESNCWQNSLSTKVFPDEDVFTKTRRKEKLTLQIINAKACPNVSTFRRLILHASTGSLFKSFSVRQDLCRLDAEPVCEMLTALLPIKGSFNECLIKARQIAV